MDRCPNCKAKLFIDHSFCPNCGSDLRQKKSLSSGSDEPKNQSTSQSADQKKTCSNCGTENENYFKFCLKCGFILKGFDSNIPKSEKLKNTEKEKSTLSSLIIIVIWSFSLSFVTFISYKSKGFDHKATEEIVIGIFKPIGIILISLGISAVISFFRKAKTREEDIKRFNLIARFILVTQTMSVFGRLFVLGLVG